MRPLSLIAPLAAAAVVAVAGLALANGQSTSSAPGAGAGPGAVNISNFKYAPASLTVKAGTKVTFTNSDSAAHTATSDTGGAFDTGGFDKGKSKVVVLKKPGTYAYHCDFHPFMHGSITVR